MKQIPVGTIVTIEAPGSRGDNGETRFIPAIVTKQWPDSSLQLYAFHFEGVPLLVNAVPLDRVRMVGQSEPVERAKSFST
jgi:hypothetical protein